MLIESENFLDDDHAALARARFFPKRRRVKCAEFETIRRGALDLDQLSHVRYLS